MKPVALRFAARLLPALLAVAAPTTALLTPSPALAQEPDRAELSASGPRSNASRPDSGYHLGAHAEVDVGILVALRQSAAFAGGVVYGPFRAGLSYATFLSNASLGGVPEGFELRVNHLVGLNASYFIGQSSDDGFYLQAMVHFKQQGVTNLDNGAERDLDSIATGLELGYVWKVYRGLYVAPRVGALYYVKKPQGSDNEPVDVGGRSYDNPRHHDWDTYYIPTLSVGYSW